MGFLCITDPVPNNFFIPFCLRYEEGIILVMLHTSPLQTASNTWCRSILLEVIPLTSPNCKGACLSPKMVGMIFIEPSLGFGVEHI
jgi:hypothetical protein